MADLKLIAQVTDVLGARREEFLTLHSGGLPILGRVLYVDALNGSDNGIGGAYKTCTAAKNAALAGDTIVVGPGTYVENNLLKNLVNWHLTAGSKIKYIDPGTGLGCGIFDDRATGAVECEITGAGILEYIGNPVVAFEAPPANGMSQAANANVRGAFVTQNAGTKIQARFSKVLHTMTFTTLGIHAGVHVYDCSKMHITVDEIYDPYDGQIIGQSEGDIYSQASGIYWNIGELYVKAGRVQGGQYSVWCLEQGAAAHSVNAWFEIDRCEGRYYIVGNGNGSNWRTWAIIKEIAPSNFYAGHGVSVGGGGRHYLMAEKTTGRVWLDGNASLWMTVQKMSYGPTTNVLYCSEADFTPAGTPTLYLDVQHIDALTNSAIKLAKGNINIRGGYCRNANGKGIEVTAAVTARIKGMRIDTTPTNAAGNNPVLIGAAGSGLVLEQCILLAPALADSIEAGGAGRVVTNYGSVANKAVEVTNLVVNVQAVLVDANVV